MLMLIFTFFILVAELNAVFEKHYYILFDLKKKMLAVFVFYFHFLFET